MKAWSRPSWRTGLLILAMTAPVARPAQAAAADRPRRSGLEQRVSLLARALQLDAGQQRSLRSVLMDQRAQAQRIWSDASLPSASRVAASKALGRQTADRIRALLTPEQRKRYDVSQQDGPPQAVANAHLEDWTHGHK